MKEQTKGMMLELSLELELEQASAELSALNSAHQFEP